MILFNCRFQVPKHISKKNQKRAFVNKRTGKGFLVQESKSKAVENWITQRLQIEKLKQRIETITDDIQVSFILEFPKSIYFTKKGTRSNKVLDISNAIQVYEDALQKSGIIGNDSQICSLDGTKRTPIDDINYYVTIEIRSLAV